jgi:DNA-binding beta-propeller fold protein YncE
VYIGTDSGVQILDGATNTIVNTIPKKAPWGVAVSLTTKRIYAGSGTEGTISQIAAPDLRTLTQWT